ncbi:hypothetical protein CH63R_13417 [Colletotrichum higginsianum IMI 349063]|uniref:Uncharacterized protein n=1 Tax=Colletotrichum higginsianum (strain IMI 349063) TaxID=759273 RepID=A0A1B7XX23_COLHI|nr:hypothetical protein CH63R_13417 [Colletotrichum higginsianum IMI 349063]OBR04290.1 hypothetical protein CH63R_13417 [Colletotrichum higginsianum IMI 349063]GJD03345.1 hypothetical protein ColKHC_12170 [Colletotrichum higginsianum]
MSATNQIQRKPSGRNPLRTVWRETYEVWDGVCHGVGKAYFKITGKWWPASPLPSVKSTQA